MITFTGKRVCLFSLLTYYNNRGFHTYFATIKWRSSLIINNTKGYLRAHHLKQSHSRHVNCLLKRTMTPRFVLPIKESGRNLYTSDISARDVSLSVPTTYIYKLKRHIVFATQTLCTFQTNISNNVFQEGSQIEIASGLCPLAL